MISKENFKELMAVPLTDYPLPCKREYNFGPYPECRTCSIERQMYCPHSPFAKEGIE